MDKYEGIRLKNLQRLAGEQDEIWYNTLKKIHNGWSFNERKDHQKYIKSLEEVNRLDTILRIDFPASCVSWLVES